MTKEQFINTSKDRPGQINIWYSDATSPISYIYGLTVPIIDQLGRNIEEYLQTATELTIELQTGIIRTLQVGNQEVYTANDGSTIYYLDVIPDYDITPIATSPTFTTTVTTVTIIFSSTIDYFVFNASGYNALLNNAEDPRPSDYQLVQGSNTPAGVQDSSYSITGWVNSRYEGSKTSELNYLGVPSTITGKTFEGAYFPRTVTDTQIKQQVAASAVVYEDYLYPGEDVLPTYTYISGSYKIPNRTRSGDPANDVGTISPTDTQIPLLLTPLAQLSTPIPKIGDIIQVTSSIELMKIKRVNYPSFDPGYGDRPLYLLTVERGYNYTTAEQIVTQVGPPAIEPPVNLSYPLLIYKLPGNKIQTAQRGKILVKLSGEILHIDRFGFVVSGSFLPA